MGKDSGFSCEVKQYIVFSALKRLYVEVAKVHLTSVIYSLNQLGYKVFIASQLGGVEFMIKGLSEVRVIKEIITSLASRK